MTYGRRALTGALACVLVMLCIPGLAWAEAPYFTLTQNHTDWLVYSQHGYLPDGTFTAFDELALKSPADVFVYGDDTLFIADEGNKRVIHCDDEGTLLGVFGAGALKNPAGLYARDGRLYVADTGLEQVLVYDVETGTQVFVLEHPRTPLYGLSSAFKPTRVAVDSAGSIYVIGKGNTNGIAQFSADGAFLGYFGANETNLSLWEKIKRLTYTDDQLANLKRNVPSTPTSLDMDARGLIYTVTTGAELGGMRKLNMAGRNILPAVTRGLDFPVDIAVGAVENLFVIDEQGYIMEYTRDGRVMFYFGGEDADRTRTGLFVAASAIDVDSQGNLYAVDRDKGLVQRYARTEYARLVHEALALYQDGFYAQSREPWEAVLTLNSLFDYAYMGLGEAYYKLERYDEALTAFRRGGDKDGYSDAYWEVRNVWLQENILLLAGVVIAALLLLRLWRLLRARVPFLRRATNAVGRVGAMRLPRELRYMAYVPRNPADAFYGVRFEGKVSVLSGTILYAAVFLFYMLRKYGAGFLFKAVEDGQWEVFTDVTLVFGGIALFLMALHLICSIRDGEATFGQMYCGLAYALTPYILLTPLAIGLTYVLTYNEAFVLTLVDIVAIAGCLVLIVMMVRTLNDYSFRETFVTLLLTLFTMLMIIIALFIAVALVAQLWEFITSVYKEASFYNET